MKFNPICGKCHHQFTISATPEQYKSMQRTLQIEAPCPRASCRAINTIRMLDDDFGGGVISWRMPDPAKPLAQPSVATEPPQPNHDLPAARPPFPLQPAAPPPRMAPSLSSAPAFSPAVAPGPHAARVAENPAEIAPPRSTAGPPPFKRGVIDGRSQGTSSLQNQLDRFSQLPPALQYLLLALLFGLAILILLYESPRPPGKTGPATAAESRSNESPPANQPTPAP